MATRSRRLAGAVMISAPIEAEQLLRRCHAQPQQRAQRLDPGHPSQLFALVSGSSVIGNRNLVNAITQAQHPRGDIGLNVEAATTEIEPPPEVRSEGLVTRLKVRDVAIEK